MLQKTKGNYCQKEIRKRTESIVWKEKQDIYKKQLLLQKAVVFRRAKRLENEKCVHTLNVTNNSKGQVPMILQILSQLKELESAWEERLAKHQTLNQNQCPEYQSKACLHEKCLKCFLFLNLSQIFFNKRYFGRHLYFGNGISGLIMNALISYV